MSLEVEAIADALLDATSAGNGGVANTSANGGAVSIDDINSGGNVGNAIAVGDTACAEGSFNAPGGNGPGGEKSRGGRNAPGGNAGGSGGRGGKVKALPNTGIGMGEHGTSDSLLLALGSLGMVVLSLGYDRQRRLSQAGGR